MERGYQSNFITTSSFTIRVSSPQSGPLVRLHALSVVRGIIAIKDDYPIYLNINQQQVSFVFPKI